MVIPNMVKIFQNVDILKRKNGDILYIYVSSAHACRVVKCLKTDENFSRLDL